MPRIREAAAVFLGALLAASPAEGQARDRGDEMLESPVVYGGVQLTYARPVGEFREYVQHGAGVNANVVWTPRRDGPLALRADGGFIVYGSETKRVCFSTTVGCRVQLDLTTTNSIAYLNAGPQLMVPAGPIRPYANAAIGLSYFSTTSQVEGSQNSEPFASSTNFDDITLAWLGGGGVLIPLAGGRTPVLLDIGVRYNGNGQVEYLKRGDIEDNPDGSITFRPTRSAANLVTFQVGVSVGIRSSRQH
jgi:opacity protein-like surface antigen